MNRTGRNNWKVVLIPFSWLYGAVIWIRNSLYDNGILKSSGFNIPLISVGNITVGGTGKTPHVEYLAGLLDSEFRVATLSRGYKRKTRDFRIASADSTVREIGDEPLQIKKRFPGTTVAVDRKRANGIKMLMKQTPPVEVILMDDAYQHRSVKPGFSILLIDYTRPIDCDRLLPAGMMREPASNRNRANIILVTRSPERIKPIELREYVNRIGLSIGQHLFFTTMRYGDLSPVYPESTRRDAAWFKNHVGGVLIVAGIANPRPLRQYARSINTNIVELSFPDHHCYSGRDIEKISDTYHELKKNHQEILVLTTEKDAMRLRDHNPEPEVRNALHAVRIYVHFLNDDKDEFDRQILNYVNSNKRSSILYQGEDS
ncbi:MAG: tetraacyldisaccharide 4'-kinase [Bacteroidales bacterium]|nr:tetraacyldisaccharide 4'-kinase [Bacteroidales bacterium]